MEVVLMAMMLKGITVTLYEKTENGRDSTNRTIYRETPTEVSNVLVAPSTETEVLDSLNLTGRKAIYTLGIPKGDQHDWENVRVDFFGRKWKTIGMPVEGIEAMIPLDWNKKVRVEAYGSNQDSNE